ncbi:MAG TPA: PH domain-containing protein [Thermodesulfobacteriota bacterium]|nr:PH domain-containing protein [Thermodesulfobacteriota bacterium]
MNRHFNVAPWPTSLKLFSFLGTTGLIIASYAAYRAIPTLSGFTHNFGLCVALVPLLLLIGCLDFIVSGYTVGPKELSVHRLLTLTTVPLTGLERAWADPAACKGSFRVYGNGGLFSFTGRFYNKRLGSYRAFVTDFHNAIVLKFHDRVVVISPAAPRAFLNHLHHIFPDLKVGDE